MALHVQGRHRARAGAGNGLPIEMVRHVPGREHALDRRRSRRPHHRAKVSLPANAHAMRMASQQTSRARGPYHRAAGPRTRGLDGQHGAVRARGHAHASRSCGCSAFSNICVANGAMMHGQPSVGWSRPTAWACRARPVQTSATSAAAPPATGRRPSPVVVGDFGLQH